MKISNLFESEKKFATSYYNKNGKLHRDDKPAVIRAGGRKEWWLNGECHREDGPAIIQADGTKEWYQNGERHREDGPAIIWTDGDKAWYQYGKCHRDDGPAIIWTDGHKEWYNYGNRHREDGPAVDGKNRKEWWNVGERFRKDGPAIISKDEQGYITKEWYMDTRKAPPDQWYNYAIYYPNGNICILSLKNAMNYLSRKDGPAFQQFSSDETLYQEEYRLHGQLHREDGPAKLEYKRNVYTWYNKDTAFYQTNTPDVDQGIINKAFKKQFSGMSDAMWGS